MCFSGSWLRKKGYYYGDLWSIASKEILVFLSMWFLQRKGLDDNDWCLTVLTFIRESRQQNRLQSKWSKLINHCFWLINQKPNKNLQYVLRDKITKSEAHNGTQQGIKNNWTLSKHWKHKKYQGKYLDINHSNGK